MTSAEKQAWIYAEEHKVRRTIRVVESARKAEVASWDRKLRILGAYIETLEHAADDADQLELFSIDTATPEDVSAIIDNPSS